MPAPKFSEVIDLPKSIEGDVSKAIVAIAEVAIMMSEIISLGDLQSNLGREVGENSDGDNQKALDVLADEAFMKKLSSSSVSWYASEEQEEVVELNKNGSVFINSLFLTSIKNPTPDPPLLTNFTSELRMKSNKKLI